MTTQELEQLSEDFENQQRFSYEEGSVAEGYQAGALKMLALVLAALDAAPIYTHYDMEDALKPFTQLLS